MGVADRAQPVRDRDHGTALHQPLERLHHEFLGFGVERGSRLVQDEDRRVADDGAGDADALAWPPDSVGPRSPTIVS